MPYGLVLRRPVLLSAALLVLALAFAPRAEAFVYWANWDASSGTTIGRANLDGSMADQSFITGANGPCGVEVDSAHVYWGNLGTNSIGRANLDGTMANPSFITGATGPCGVAVDGSHVYWANFQDPGSGGGPSIGRANLDGSGADQNFIPGAEGPCGVAVDSAHVYWANFDTNRIGRANLDGSGADQNFITAAVPPCGVAVDSAHVYWGNCGGPSCGGTSVGRANLDGSGADQNFISITGASGPCGVEVDSAHVYWANYNRGTIGRANLDGSGADPDFIPGASLPCGDVALTRSFAGAPYPTPNSASHIDVSLVPAFRQTISDAQCSARGGTPKTHALPFSVSSCDPPALAPGTRAYFGRDAGGDAQLVVLPGDPSTTADEGDQAISATLTDIRASSITGTDYNPNPSGPDATLVTRLRISDLLNGPSQNDPGTTVNLELSAPVDCSDTASPSIGATCTINTTADAVLPDAIKEGKQAVVSVLRVRLSDSGADGVRGNSDDRMFAQQGLFHP